MSQRCAGRNAEVWPTYYYGLIVFASVCNFLAFAICFYGEVCMVLRKEIRNNTFNLYVLFLLLPDTINNLMNFILGVFRASNCGTIPQKFGDVYDCNIFFFYFTNFFLNCLVAYQLHAFLERCRKGIRTGPPPVKQTLWQVAVVYSFAILWTVWGMVDVSWSWWYRKKSQFGSPPGGFFSEIQAICMTAGIMVACILFVIAIRIRIWKNQLIPTRGQTRVVSLFFERIIIVFLVFYFPSLGLLAYSTTIRAHSPTFFWVERSSQILAALQALVTLYCASIKPDICNVIWCGKVSTQGSSGLSSSGGRRWSIFGGSNANKSTGRRWSWSIFGNRRSRSHQTNAAVNYVGDSTGRAASATMHQRRHLVRDHSPIETSSEQRLRRNSNLVSSEIISMEFVRPELINLNEWVMEDIYETQITSGVVDEDDIEGDSAVDDENTTPALANIQPESIQGPEERALGQRLVGMDITSEEVVFDLASGEINNDD